MMYTRQREVITAVLCGFITTQAWAAGPPFADKEQEAPKREKPKMLTWSMEKTDDGKKIQLKITMEPGVAKKGEVAQVTVSANAILSRPDPVYGTQAPVVDAPLVAEVKDPSGTRVGRYRMHPVQNAKGRYAMHFTPPVDGVFTLALFGKSPKGEDLAAEFKIPVDVWPLPKEIADNASETVSATRQGIPAQPKKEGTP